MARIRSDTRSRSGFPYLNCCVVTTGDNMIATRRPGHGFYRTSMATICAGGTCSDTQTTTSGNIPNSQGRIMPTGNNLSAIGRPGEGINRARMSMIGEKIMLYMVRRGNLPHLHATIKAARGNAVRQPERGCRIAWRPGNRKYPVLTIMGIDLLSAKGLPDLYCAITVISTRGDVLAIGGP